MSTSSTTDNQTQESTNTHFDHGHVHGPGCNHGHHHHSDAIPFVRSAPKVGANEQCPCGSGKKYKKCCRQ
jgi:uncharacterized protein YecA (UPF0149 family)